MPEIIGDYKIEYLIGKGSYGTVYKAHHIITKDVNIHNLEKQDVALKFSQSDEEDEKDGIHSTTLREMGILKLMKGIPHIIQ